LSQSEQILKVLGYEYENSQKEYEDIDDEHFESTHSGALMDLVCRGKQDVYLNGNSQFWKSDYKRVTKSSLHKFIPKLDCVNPTLFVANNLRHCDLLRKISLHVDFLINNKTVNKSVLTKDNNIMYKLIDNIKLISNGYIIESLSGYQIHMISLMNNNPSQRILNDKKINIIDIPFSFSSIAGNAFPIVACPDLRIEIKIKEGVLNNFIVVKPKLYCSGVFLDSDERRQTYQNNCDRLYSYYHKVIESTTFNNNRIQCKLDYNHPTKAIFFTLHDNDRNIVEDLISFKLSYSGQTRATGGKRDCGIINRLESNIHPESPVFVIPFALDPFNDEQPTTHVNLSVLDNIILYLNVDSNVKYARVWGNYWNILRIGLGMACMAFS